MVTGVGDYGCVVRCEVGGDSGFCQNWRLEGGRGADIKPQVLLVCNLLHVDRVLDASCKLK